MMLRHVWPSPKALVLGALLALASACGGEDDGARRALSSADGGRLGELTPVPRDPAVTSLSPPHVGREESRGHQAEAGRAGHAGESAPSVPDDLACGYVCRGFATCFAASETGTCPVCENTLRLRAECRPRFETGEACLRQFDAQLCQNPKEFGIQFLSICGFPVGSDECFQRDGS